MELIIRDTATAALDYLGAKVREPHPVAEAAGLAIVSLAERSFNDASVRAAPWAALKEATVRAKLRAHLSTSILKAHGVLFHSFRITAATNDSVQVGTFVPYAAPNQFGSKDGRLPARPMLPITGVPPNVKLTSLGAKRMKSAAQRALNKLTELPGA